MCKQENPHQFHPVPWMLVDRDGIVWVELDDDCYQVGSDWPYALEAVRKHHGPLRRFCPGHDWEWDPE